MHDRRFWCDEFEELADRRLAPDEAHHAARTLRMRPGDSVELIDGRGATGYGCIKSVETKGGRNCEVIVQLQSLLRLNAPCPRLTLIVAECKGERLDWMIEKCTELGVGRIWLTEFERSVVHAGAGKIERLGRIARQACKQSGASRLPEIRSGRSLETAVAEFNSTANAKCFIADPKPSERSFLSVLSEVTDDITEVAAIVGPEGGISDAEVAMIQKLGIQSVRLANSILRVETAAVSFAALAECCRMRRIMDEK